MQEAFGARIRMFTCSSRCFQYMTHDHITSSNFSPTQHVALPWMLPLLPSRWHTRSEMVLKDGHQSSALHNLEDCLKPRSRVLQSHVWNFERTHRFASHNNWPLTSIFHTSKGSPLSQHHKRLPLTRTPQSIASRTPLSATSPPLPRSPQGGQASNLVLTI